MTRGVIAYDRNCCQDVAGRSCCQGRGVCSRRKDGCAGQTGEARSRRPGGLVPCQRHGRLHGGQTMGRRLGYGLHLRPGALVALRHGRRVRGSLRPSKYLVRNITSILQPLVRRPLLLPASWRRPTLSPGPGKRPGRRPPIARFLHSDRVVASICQEVMLILYRAYPRHQPAQALILATGLRKYRPPRDLRPLGTVGPVSERTGDHGCHPLSS
jgi:hypothetical protein